RAGLGDFEPWAQEETTRRLQQIYFALARAHLTLPPDPEHPHAVILSVSDLEKLDARLLTDPWGRPFRVHQATRVSNVAAIRSRYLVASAGPDGIAGSSDDLYPIDYDFHRRVYRLADVMGIQGGLAGDAFGRGGLGLRGMGAGGGGRGE